MRFVNSFFLTFVLLGLACCLSVPGSVGGEQHLVYHYVPGSWGGLDGGNSASGVAFRAERSQLTGLRVYGALLTCTAQDGQIDLLDITLSARDTEGLAFYVREDGRVDGSFEVPDYPGGANGGLRMEVRGNLHGTSGTMNVTMTLPRRDTEGSECFGGVSTAVAKLARELPIPSGR